MRETPTTTTNDGMKGSVAITDNSALRTASTSDPIGTISASIMAGITSGNDETTTTTSTTASSLYVELSPDNSSEDNQQRLWNLSKLALTTTTATATTTTTSSIIAASGGESTTSSLSTTYDASTSVTTAPYAVPTTTLDPFDEFGPPEGVEYIFVPLGVVVSVIILSAVVWVAISLLSLTSRDVFPPCLALSYPSLRPSSPPSRVFSFSETRGWTSIYAWYTLSGERAVYETFLFFRRKRFSKLTHSHNTPRFFIFILFR